MGYPWPSFSTFTFSRDEAPEYGTDSGWKSNPNYARNPVLGGVADSIIVTGRGSLERTFTVYLSEPRLAELMALLATTAQFCDWSRPTPDARSAFLSDLQAGNSVEARNYGRKTDAIGQPVTSRRPVKVTLVSQ